MTFRFLLGAEQEIEAARDWYARQRPQLAGEFLDDLAVSLEAVERNPRLFGKVSVRKRAREVRCRSLDRFPYAVYYEVGADELIVLAVAHHSRRADYWKHREG